MLLNARDLIDSDLKYDNSEIIRVKDICPHMSHIITANSNENISSAFRKMIDNGILALPLYDIETSQYVSFIDIFDILAYIIEEGINDEWLIKNEFISTPCSELPNRSLRNPFHVINENSSLQSAIDYMYKTGVVRLAIVNDKGDLISILTQTRIIRHLANKSHFMGHISKIPIKSIKNFGNTEVIGIKESEPAINAFIKIYEYNIGGVAIFNDNNEVIGNISVADLKDIGHNINMFQKLNIKASEFLNNKVEGADIPSLVWISESDTLQVLLEKFRKHWIHRIYVIDIPTRKTKGVISATDIISLFNSISPPLIQRE